jgi:hypothetical protein
MAIKTRTITKTKTKKQNDDETILYHIYASTHRNLQLGTEVKGF